MNGHKETVEMIDPKIIQPNPHQMRTKINDGQLAELKTIVEKNGHIDAITVTILENGTYQLVDGQQRLKVAIELGWEKIPATITNNENLISKTFAANFFRYQLNPVQNYDGLNAVMKEQKLGSQQALAEYLNVSESTASQMMSIDKLSKKIQSAIRKSELLYPKREVYKICRIKGDDKQQEAFDKLTEKLKSIAKDKKEGKAPISKIAAEANGVKLSKVVQGVTKTIEKTFMPRIDKIEEAMKSEKTDHNDKVAVCEELAKLRDRINELISRSLG